MKNDYFSLSFMKISRYLSLGFLVFSFSLNTLYGAGETDACETKKGFDLYTCRTKKICETYKPQKPIFKTQKYINAKSLGSTYIWTDSLTPALQEAKTMYRNNMGTIYKCAMIQSQRNSLTFLKEQLKTDRTWEIDNTIGRQIEQRIQKLELTASTLHCALTEKKKFLIKKELLDETTYEMCQYISYLSYLRVYYSDTKNILGIDTPWQNNDFEKQYQTTEIAELIGWVQWDISAETSHTYKIFPLVFQAYIEYENNFPIHYMLEIIHADFLLLKKKMYQVVMPIAQVGYKIINAMSK